MAEKPTEMEGDKIELGSATVDRTCFQQALRDCVRVQGIDLQCSVLIVGGSYEDAVILRNVGFRNMTLTNLQDLADFELPPLEGAELDAVNADAEDMQFADDSYDLVLAHETLHHCRSPHKALLEMLRVSRRHVIIQEPNDSLMMHTFVKLRFSFPYELPSVIFHNFKAGGVRNTCVPNYIYRWNAWEMYQTAASYMPESEFGLYIRRYWDFNVDKDELALRSQTRIGSFTKILGPSLFLACLHGFQAVMNRLPWVGGQGNKFFGCITKLDDLKPWLVRDSGRIVFNQNYAKRK
ncbi:MAG: class I SAM-dependent methyltransferase [Terracidiphilus sp.]|jgi:SAM-dependent methyltransferase